MDRIEILFESTDILAVNKPGGLAAIPENDMEKESLISRLSYQTGQKLFVVHRLDKEASGVMLVARNAEAHRCLNDQFAGRKVSKQYIALVLGCVTEEQGVISKGIREFGSGRMGVDDRNGKASDTRYRVVERINGYTLLRLSPRTGRRHQIRVHLYSLGHAIVGDLRYGEHARQKSFPRLMLHAESIQFADLAGVEQTVVAPVPDSFQAVLDLVREGQA